MNWSSRYLQNCKGLLQLIWWELEMILSIFFLALLHSKGPLLYRLPTGGGERSYINFTFTGGGAIGERGIVIEAVALPGGLRCL